MLDLKNQFNTGKSFQTVDSLKSSDQEAERPITFGQQLHIHNGQKLAVVLGVSILLPDQPSLTK